MGSFLQEFLTLLITPPGNFAYHLFVLFSIGWALQASYSHWRTSDYPQTFRATIGMSLLLFAQLILITFAALSHVGIFSEQIVLPPIDRCVGLFSLVIIIWLWAFPEPSRLGDSATTLLGILALVLTIPAFILWNNVQPDPAFNASWLDTTFNIAGIALSILGCIVLIARRPNGWGLGLGMIVLLFVGYLGSLTFAYQADYSYAGIIRLTQLAAYPLLLGLPTRFPLPLDETEKRTSAVTIREKRRYDSDPQLIQEFLKLASNSTSGQICSGLVKVISKMMVADLSYLVSMPEEGKQLTVSCGYDLIREKPIEGFSIDERLSPIISSALRRGRAVRLPASSTSPDLLGFANVLGMGRVGHMLIAPFPLGRDGVFMGLVLLSPYSNRGWTTDDQENLSQITGLMALILQKEQPSTTLQDDLAAANNSLDAAQKEIEKLRQENEALSTKQDAEIPTEVSEDSQPTNPEMQQLQEQLRLTLEEITVLEGENQKLKTSANQNSEITQSEINQLEEQLKISLQEITRLNERLYEADQRLLEVQVNQQHSHSPSENSDLIAAMSQELRQPMSSILGYTELLLGESVGLLGAGQRKFVDRIKAASERMGSLIEDLVHLSTGDENHNKTGESVNLGSAIDEAITASVGQFREKNIALRVDLPEKLPQIEADPDALQQILIHLLLNAGQASPEDGEISLQATVEDDDRDSSFVLIRVSDNGEGIPPEELPRVFSRLYRADNALIPGVGDTGVGLSIVKSLVEAQNGRIWVDSQKGEGSVFSILLPLAQQPVEQIEQPVPSGNGHGGSS